MKKNQNLTKFFHWQFMSVAAANNYCCEKQMKLASLETRFEIKCLGNEIKSEYFNSIFCCHTNLISNWTQSSKMLAKT